MVSSTLLDLIKPCGPVADPAAAERVHRDLDGRPWLEAAWPALAPVAGASAYLGGIMRRNPEMLGRVLAAPPQASLDRLLKAAEAKVEKLTLGADGTPKGTTALDKDNGSPF